MNHIVTVKYRFYIPKQIEIIYFESINSINLQNL